MDLDRSYPNPQARQDPRAQVNGVRFPPLHGEILKRQELERMMQQQQQMEQKEMQRRMQEEPIKAKELPEQPNMTCPDFRQTSKKQEAKKNQ